MDQKRERLDLERTMLKMDTLFQMQEMLAQRKYEKHLSDVLARLERLAEVEDSIETERRCELYLQEEMGNLQLGVSVIAKSKDDVLREHANALR